jgi:hypothetical protein
MFESLQILGFLVLAAISLIGFAVGIVLALCARRNNSLRRPARLLLSATVALFLVVLPMGLLMFHEFYLNENLVLACRRGDIDEAKWLLSLWASPNAEAIHGTDDALGAASEGGHRELVELLLGKGAKVGHKDFHGRTALQRAREAGHADIVLLLQQSEHSR